MLFVHLNTDLVSYFLLHDRHIHVRHRISITNLALCITTSLDYVLELDKLICIDTAQLLITAYHNHYPKILR